ncbi:unnamed protein product [Linum tenue]|uniref:Uncharacterized protein n=2 Tax=Linum tenue TaxID=586396 RepID=A0AAV0LGT5_9ROSI|nr:unnamed protein product [Linum tenue]CAI0432596.1 unnamed protein product [Linum tenue]
MAPGTKGGILFDTQIGLNFTTTTMSAASDFSWQTFQQNASADRRSLPQVSLFIDSDVQGIAYHDYQAAQIYIDADYLANLTSSNDDDLRREFAGLVYAQMASVWGWNGNSTAPAGLLSGIGGYVRAKAGYEPKNWAEAGEGEKWDQGDDVTARFLEYCDGLRNGSFVAEINSMMKDTYSNGFFAQLLGKDVADVWKDYKAKYGNLTAS